MAFRLYPLIPVFITILTVPFLLVLWFILLLLNLACAVTGFAAKRAPVDSSPASGLATIIVLNWNGRHLLQEGLPSILKAVQVDGRSHEVMVVDNGSTDDSVEYVQKHFPEVRILALPENRGFAEGNNAGVRAAKHDVAILLNNDMVVDPNFIAPLLKGFGPRTFAVASQIFHQDSSQRREETGKTTATFRRGMIDYSHREMESEFFPRSYYPVLWAGGGSSAFHRKKFLSLGGFHSLYSPAYVEDTDLSYQAWKAGWEVLLAPESKVHHKHRASAKRRFRKSELQVLIARNQFLFIWKNIGCWKLLMAHGIFLPWNCYRLMRNLGLAAWLSLLRAFGAIPSVIAARIKPRFQGVRSDPEIFDLISKPGIYFGRRRFTHQFSSTETRPRLLWLTAYLPHTGRHAGAGRMFQLLKRLSSKYRITLITFLEADEERAFLPEAESLCEKVIAMKRIHPRRWRLFAYEPFDEFLTPEMEKAVDRCLEDCDFDLIQLEYTQMACYAKRSSGIPVLLTKHEVDFAACGRRARKESNPIGKLRWFYNYLQVLDREVQLTKGIDAVICMTGPDARELSKFCPAIPTFVINTGVDIDYFKPPDQPAVEPRMIFVGAFQHMPNVDAMKFFCRDVLPLIQSRIPEIELLIVGSNPPPPIASLAETPGVQVTGFVPDIRPFMARSSIYIVPLNLGVGIRGKILEAWAMGMAVVSTSVGCAGLRYEHNRNILVADTPKQFADRIFSLVKDPSRRQYLGEEGRRTVEQHYSWEGSARQLEALYRHYIDREDAHREFAPSKSPALTPHPKSRNRKPETADSAARKS